MSGKSLKVFPAFFFSRFFLGPFKSCLYSPIANSLGSSEFSLFWVHHDHDLSPRQLTPAVVIDEMVGSRICGKEAGVKFKVEVFIDQIKFTNGGRPTVLVQLGLQNFVVSFKDGIDLGDKQRFVPGIDAYPFPVSRIAAGIIAIFFIPSAM